MKIRHLALRAATAFAAAALLASCGGGNDNEAGGLTAFNITPSALTLTGPNEDTCGVGHAGRVYVFGGSAPYRVFNSGAGVPGNEFIVLSRTTLDRPGEYFDVTLLGCMTTIPVTVVDQQGRQVTLSLSSVKG
ncbi:hypothetical protein ACPOLB_19085 [Rubrivivax sp. RP6-9]|uniref:hypothetical protein n=1 Tax=Rubrivivax sp. RP6-9 TaxID=3415750 RepID=UPI003CC54A4D